MYHQLKGKSCTSYYKIKNAIIPDNFPQLKVENSDQVEE